MTRTTKTTKQATRKARGLYMIPTAFGEAQALRQSGEWHITYPGDEGIGDITSTLGGAKELVAWWEEAKAEREARYAKANEETR
jgi:hypothetical protein